MNRFRFFQPGRQMYDCVDVFSGDSHRKNHVRWIVGCLLTQTLAGVLSATVCWLPPEAWTESGIWAV